MAVGLEGRDPLLDHFIIEYTAGLPSTYFLRGDTSKYLLRKILYKYLPREYVDRPKRGFSIPLKRWLKHDLKQFLLDYLNESRIKRAGILDWKTVECELGRFFEGQDTLDGRIWLLLEFEMWRERWLR
jgi:asparagine synthase (glutamine-hydrolysing)